MTVDGQHIVDAVPGAEGMFVAAGCNVSGLSISPAIGQLLAEWVVDGAPSVDLSPMSITRFGPEWADDATVLAAARSQYVAFYHATI
jgi:4-methylaminobutanoate oxidase (formaldehyde-forming)